ncbi:bpX6 domain-containing protein [Pseudomonas sp. IzPS59]|uniref:bpX6 domain-containing protein n=1 Tax=Pseudomonas sp. IzPS59 TaxID=2774459 RepID=UPI001787FAC9|nr:bpX6 domain-containing protein [Pseudomonas sp. IzPS59]
MLEHDAALIRRPVLTGHQQIEGLWFPAERFDESERARQILDHWQTGARACRFDDGDLLRFRQPVSVQCDALVGWPLIRQGHTLCSAPLTPQEVARLPAADVWLVRGSHVSALQLRDAITLAPGEWIDVGTYTLLDTFDCSSALPEPAPEPRAVPTDVREILGGALGPVSPEREGVMRALLERPRTAAKSQPDQPVKPSNSAWKSTEVPSWPWLKLGVTFLVLVALFWMATQGQSNGLPPTPVAPEHSAPSDIGAVVLGTVIGSVLFTLLLMGVRKLLRPVEPILPGAARSSRASTPPPTKPPIAPRARPVRHKTAVWRRLLTRLTQHSRLSALYGRRQADYMRRMLAMFENGDLEEALRHAIPLGGGQDSVEQAFGTPQRRQELAISQNQGPSRSMLFEEDLESHLRKIYRQTFERLDRELRIEEAVFVLAELLKDRQEALDYLEKHGRQQQAADLALAWDMPAAMIVRLLSLAGNWERALQVARRDDAFADAVLMLQEKWPANADALRLEWAKALVEKGLWLQAVEVIWSLPAEREQATQWLLNAEAAGGRLAMGALVKRAVLLPDTLVAYGAWIEQLRDDPQRSAERAALAEALLQQKSETNALAWLAGATVHAIIADQACDHGRLTRDQLKALIKMSKDKLLQADLPEQALPRAARVPLERVASALEWEAPDRGNLPIFDAVPLEDARYLVALGEAGALVIDAAGKTLFHFPIPAQAIVLAHGRQVALALARRDNVWRISKLDLVNGTVKDLGVLMLDVFARSFDGTAWTIGRGQQLRVVDVDRGFETLWQVSDLPGHIVRLETDEQNECLWLSDPEQGSQLWCYRLPARRLLSREPMPAMIYQNGFQLVDASGEVTEFMLQHKVEEDPVLVLEQRNSRKNYRLPGYVDAFAYDPVLSVYLCERWLLIGYGAAGDSTHWQFNHRQSDRICATLQWPAQSLQVRRLGADWLLFDRQGRLSHINVDEASQRNISLN